jgi:AcrR family transcriptional regulator
LTDEFVSKMGFNMSVKISRRGRPKNQTHIEQRKETILESAIAIFAQEGYADTDLQVIANSLQIAKGTIYRYFPSKERLFFAAVDLGLNQLRDYVRNSYLGIEDPLLRLQTAIHAYLEYFKRHPETAELMIIERATFRDRKKSTYFEHQKTNQCQWYEIFDELIKNGRVRNVPVERIIHTISDLVYGTMFTNHFSARHKSLETQVEDVVDILFHGILTPQEKKQWES